MTFAKWTRPHFCGRRRDLVSVGSGSDTEWLGVARRGRIDADSVDLVYWSDSPAKTLAWPGQPGPVYPGKRSRSGLNSSGCCATCGHDGSPLKMFPGPAFLRTGNQATPTSVSYFGGWSTSGTAWPGGFWTRAGSESPSVAIVCSLSTVLETRPVPRRYWLSARSACGRASSDAPRSRGKDLAPTLDDGARRASVWLPMTAFASAGQQSRHGRRARQHVELQLHRPVLVDRRRPGAPISSLRGSIDYRMDIESDNFIVAATVRTSDGHHGYSSGRGDGADNLIAFQPTGGTRGVNAGTTSPPIKIAHGHRVPPLDPLIAESSGVRAPSPRWNASSSPRVFLMKLDRGPTRQPPLSHDRKRRRGGVR